jgi:hypothetical protein
MGNRILVLAVLVILVVCGYFAYQHIHEQKLDESGEVVCKGCMTSDEKAKFEKENSGDTADGQSERKTRTAAADDKAGFPDANASVNGTPGTTAGATANNAPANNPPTTATVTPVTPTNQIVPAPQPVSAPLPQSDSQLPNAPNGMRFTGTGNYQWYRQGNITWRLDTATGRSCIIYATMEEWQKQIVMAHGCGRDA